MKKPLFYGAWNYKDPEAELDKVFPHRRDSELTKSIREANIAAGEKTILEERLRKLSQ